MSAPTTPSTKAPKPCELQFHGNGAWGKGPRFDAATAPDELLQAADLLARVCDPGLKMRVVYCYGDTGRATNNALMYWSREKGWVEA